MTDGALTLEPTALPPAPDIPFHVALDAKVSELTGLFAEYNRGGFKVQEVLAFVLECMGSLVLLARIYTDLPEREKQEKVIAALKAVYMSRNPDLPWIPEPFEMMVEHAIFDMLAPQLYRFLVKILSRV